MSLNPNYPIPRQGEGSSLLEGNLYCGADAGWVRLAVPRNGFEVPIGPESFAEGLEQVAADLRRTGESVVQLGRGILDQGPDLRKAVVISSAALQLARQAATEPQLLVEADGGLRRYDVLVRLTRQGEPIYGTRDKPAYFFNGGIFFLWRFDWDGATEAPGELLDSYAISRFGLKQVNPARIRDLSRDGTSDRREAAGRDLFSYVAQRSRSNPGRALSLNVSLNILNSGLERNGGR